jgi:hypothetical protein
MHIRNPSTHFSGNYLQIFLKKWEQELSRA